MSTHVTIVGSGASAVHFAATALDRGYRVTMLDVGHEKPAAVLPDASLVELKRRLDDPAAYVQRMNSLLLELDSSAATG